MTGQEEIYIRPEFTHREYALVKQCVADYAFKVNPRSKIVVSVLKKLQDDDDAIRFLQDQHERANSATTTNHCKTCCCAMMSGDYLIKVGDGQPLSDEMKRIIRES